MRRMRLGLCVRKWNDSDRAKVYCWLSLDPSIYIVCATICDCHQHCYSIRKWIPSFYLTTKILICVTTDFPDSLVMHYSPDVFKHLNHFATFSVCFYLGNHLCSSSLQLSLFQIPNVLFSNFLIKKTYFNISPLLVIYFLKTS